MGHAQRGAGVKLHEEVAVGDGVDAVLADAAEAKLLGHGFAIDGVGDACQRAAAQREHVGPAQAAGEPLAVALQHVEVGQQVVSKQDRLGALEMSVAGHDDVRVGLCH